MVCEGPLHGNSCNKCHISWSNYVKLRNRWDSFRQTDEKKKAQHRFWWRCSCAAASKLQSSLFYINKPVFTSLTDSLFTFFQYHHSTTSHSSENCLSELNTMLVFTNKSSHILSVWRWSVALNWPWNPISHYQTVCCLNFLACPKLSVCFLILSKDIFWKRDSLFLRVVCVHS